MLNVFQNDCSSTGEAAPLEKPELKPFLEEPEPSQTHPQCQHASGLKYTSKIKAYWPIILGEVWPPGGAPAPCTVPHCRTELLQN